MRVFPVKKLPFAALLWISSPNKKYPITVILLYETSKAVHGLLYSYSFTFMAQGPPIFVLLATPMFW